MARLSERAARRIAPVGSLRHYSAPDILLRQGDDVDDVIVLETGLVKVVTVSERATKSSSTCAVQAM